MFEELKIIPVNLLNDYALQAGQNLNSLGLFYEELDYSKAMPFLLMLVDALKD